MTLFRSGCVVIAGAPNAGKSTLLNRLLGEKLSITSKKPQTTRNRILGVVNRESSQMVFLDTPGVHNAGSVLNTRMVDIALSAFGDADVLLLVIDVSDPDKPSEKHLVSKLSSVEKPVILVLNKVDAVKKKSLPEHATYWKDVFSFNAVLEVSAKHGDGIEDLLIAIEKHLPEGPPFYPEDMITDQSVRFFAAEMIREKVFRLTGQEVPYSSAVTIDLFSEKDDIVEIYATIHVERDSQKGIIIGKGGSKIKQIGIDSRIEIEKLLEKKVFLKLNIRVQKNWTKDTKAILKFGI